MRHEAPDKMQSLGSENDITQLNIGVRKRVLGGAERG